METQPPSCFARWSSSIWKQRRLFHSFQSPLNMTLMQPFDFQELSKLQQILQSLGSNRQRCEYTILALDPVSDKETGLSREVHRRDGQCLRDESNLSQSGLLSCLCRFAWPWAGWISSTRHIFFASLTLDVRRDLIAGGAHRFVGHAGISDCGQGFFAGAFGAGAFNFGRGFPYCLASQVESAQLTRMRVVDLVNAMMPLSAFLRDHWLWDPVLAWLSKDEAAILEQESLFDAMEAWVLDWMKYWSRFDLACSIRVFLKLEFSLL